MEIYSLVYPSRGRCIEIPAITRTDVTCRKPASLYTPFSSITQKNYWLKYFFSLYCYIQKFHKFCLDCQTPFEELNKRRKTHCILTFFLFPLILPCSPVSWGSDDSALAPTAGSLWAICWCGWVWAGSGYRLKASCPARLPSLVLNHVLASGLFRPRSGA